MASEQNVASSEPKLCRNGCGFFGTETNMYLCSKCYRDVRAKEEEAVSAKAAVEKTFNHLFIKPAQVDPVVIPEKPEAVESIPEKPSVSSIVVNRCGCCNKKVGLTGFKCKCGTTFCSTHRYPEKHQCGFDYKGDGRAKIASHNPVIKADKLEKI